jgi:hypothetical protein
VKIYRSRQPVTYQGVTGYLDFWTRSEERAREEAAKSPDRIFEALSEEDIANLPPASQLKARAAWEAVYG